MILKERVHFFDNVKAFLVILVVFGHLLEYFVHVDNFFKWSYILIYSFHMPLFIFVSGFLSKSSDLKKTAPNVLFQFIVFNILYAIFTGIIFLINPSFMEDSLNRVDLNGPFNILLTILTPYWIMWYMLSLFFWKVMLILFRKSPFLLILSIVIGILFGFVDVYGRILSMQRTFALFPFFMAGYFVDYSKIENFTRKPLNKILSTAASIALALSIFLFYIDDIDINIFYHSDSFRALGFYGFNGIILRISLYLTSLIMSAIFIMFIPHRKIICTNMGLKTFNIYILHGFIIQILLAFGFFSLLKQLHTIFIFLILIVVNFLIVYLLSNDHVDIFMKKISLRKKGKD